MKNRKEILYITIIKSSIGKDIYFTNSRSETDELVQHYDFLIKVAQSLRLKFFSGRDSDLANYLRMGPN
jgi:hypothetical protein